MSIRLDPDEGLCLNSQDIPYPVPCYWASALDVLQDKSSGIAKVMHNEVGLILTRDQALALPGVPVEIEEPCCPSCDTTMRIINTSRGQFFGCPNYPNCRETRSVMECVSLVTGSE